MKKLLTALPLCVAMLIPMYVKADDHDEHRDHQRYYDKRHRDYHEWNENENRAYHAYWEQQHRRQIAWEEANERQRQAYWNWRHRHSDAVLQINIR